MNTFNSTSAGGLSARPIREDLLQMDPPRLLGSICGACAVTMFPARDYCPACTCDVEPARVALAETGIVYSFTVVRQAPPGRITPYVLAYVDLSGGARVLAQVNAAPGQLEIGAVVKLQLRCVGTDGDQQLIGYVFVPQDETERPVLNHTAEIA